jgi:hypothetical protein
MHAFPMSRCTLIVFLLSFLSISPLFAIPPSFVDDSEGWLDFTVICFWGLGDSVPSLGYAISGCGPERLGLGFGVMFGPKALILFIDGIYFWDPWTRLFSPCHSSFAWATTLQAV